MTTIHHNAALARTMSLLLALMLVIVVPGGPAATVAAETGADQGSGLPAPGTALDAPGGLVAEAGSAVVRLDWEPAAAPAAIGESPAASLPELLGYRIYRRLVTGNPTQSMAESVVVATTTPGVTDWLDYGVSNGLSYAYTVRAVYEGKLEGPPSPEVVVTPRGSDLSIVLVLGRQATLVNGQDVILDAPAQLIGSRTMVPLRFVSTYLGASVVYEPADRSITARLGGRTVRLWIDRTEAEIDGTAVTIDSAPVIVGGRTMVPVRFIAEAYDAVVGYDGPTRRVTVVMPDDDATLDTAAMIFPDTPVDAALSGANDTDLFCFHVSPGEVYRVQTDDLAFGCDTVLAVITPTGAVLGWNDDRSYGDHRSEITVIGEPGDSLVYVRVQSAAPGGARPGGNYRLTMTRVSETHASPRSAGPLRSGTPVHGSLSAASATDWYLFQAAAGRTYAFRTADLFGYKPEGGVLEGDTALYLLAPDGRTRLAADDDSSTGELGASHLVWECRQDGRYYLVVGSAAGRPGPYTLTMEESRRDIWNSRADAVKTRPDHDSWLEWLSATDDEDWYSFDVPVVGGTYYIQTVDLAPGVDTVIELYYAYGSEPLAVDDDTPGFGSDALNEYSLSTGSLIAFKPDKAGPFYVRVRTPGSNPVTGATGPAPTLGSYSFCVTTTAPESDNSAVFATRLEVGGAPLLRSLVPGDRDWFVVDVVPGVTYTFRTADLSPGCDTDLLVMDKNGDLLAANDDADYPNDPSSSAQWTSTFRGTVYVVVRGYYVSADEPGTGTYTIKVTAEIAGKTF